MQNLGHAVSVIVIRSIRDKQRTGREMFAGSVERLFRDLNGCTFEFVDQRQKRNLARVRDGEYRARARNLAGERRRIVKRRHLRLENRRIDNTHNLHIEEMRERPSRVVVGMLLRIASSPELVIEQRIGHTGIGLVHADDNAACRKRFFLRLVSALFRRNRGSHCLG